MKELYDAAVEAGATVLPGVSTDGYTFDDSEAVEGTVRSIMPYGCFVEILPGKDGLLHISEIDWKRLEKIGRAHV